MGDRVLEKIVSEVLSLITRRDYVPCYKMDIMKAATLKRLVLRHERQSCISRCLKGKYEYTILDVSLGDHGVLMASVEDAGDSSLLHDNSLFIDVFLTEFTPTSVSAIASSARMGLLDGAVSAEAGVKACTSTSTSKISLYGNQIEGSNLQRLISELENSWHFNKENRYWEIINGKNNYQLCFISYCVKANTEITAFREDHLRGDACVSLLDSVAKLSLEGSEMSSLSVVIPEGSTFAYKVKQLKIDSDGSITVPADTMATPGDEDTQNESAETEINRCRDYYNEYFGKLSAELRASVRQALQRPLSGDAALLTDGLVNQNPDCEQQGSIGSSSDCSLPINDVSRIDRLVHIKKMAKAALPIRSKEKEIADLLRELGVSERLDEQNKLAAVFGIRVFTTALLQLPLEGLSLLFDVANRADAEQHRLKIVKALECLLENEENRNKTKQNQEDSEILDAFSLNAALRGDRFVYAWRSAYIACVHMFGLPIEGTAATS